MTNPLLFLLAMVSVFLIFNVMVSTVVEAWNTWHAKRGKYLWAGIAQMVGGGTEGGEILQGLSRHPAIEALEDDDRAASYIPSETFAAALIDVIMERNANARLDKYGLPEAIALLSPALRMKRPLEMALAASKGDRAAFVRSVGRLYDSCMDRVSGRYKRDAQKKAVWFGLVLAILLNFDAVHIATALWRDPTTGQVLIDQASALGAGLNAPATAGKPPVAGDKSMPVLPQQLPVGWPPRWHVELGKAGKEATRWDFAWHFFAMLFGMAIMGASCLLGAPMWYQILASLLPLRGAGKVPPRIDERKTASGPGAAADAPLGTPPDPSAPSAPEAQPWLNELERSVMDQNGLEEIQKKLGVAQTGAYDAATRAAIRAWQAKKEYAATGQLTRLLLYDLGFEGRF